MSLDLTPLPTAADLVTFSHGETDVFTVDERNQAIDMASVLLWLATDLEHYTGDATVDKIIKWGILDQAWCLLLHTENKTAQASGFSSERIGSYSYSIAQGRIASGQDTGCGWFDTAVKLLLGAAGTGAGAVWSSTEWVFTEPFCNDSALPFPLADPCEIEHPLWVDGGGV